MDDNASPSLIANASTPSMSFPSRKTYIKRRTHRPFQGVYYQLTSHVACIYSAYPPSSAVKASTGTRRKVVSMVPGCVRAIEAAPTNPKNNDNHQQQNARNRQQYAPRLYIPKWLVCGLLQHHRLMECSRYLALYRKGRINWISDSKRCQRCLSPRHTIDQCPPTNTCIICSGGNHHV